MYYNLDYSKLTDFWGCTIDGYLHCQLGHHTHNIIEIKQNKGWHTMKKLILMRFIRQCRYYIISYLFNFSSVVVIAVILSMFTRTSCWVDWSMIEILRGSTHLIIISLPWFSLRRCRQSLWHLTYSNFNPPRPRGSSRCIMWPWKVAINYTLLKVGQWQPGRILPSLAILANGMKLHCTPGRMGTTWLLLD